MGRSDLEAGGQEGADEEAWLDDCGYPRLGSDGHDSAKGSSSSPLHPDSASDSHPHSDTAWSGVVRYEYEPDEQEDTDVLGEPKGAEANE